MTCGVFRCIAVELGVFRCISVFTLTRSIYASMKHRLVCVGLRMIDCVIIDFEGLVHWLEQPPIRAHAFSQCNII